MRNLFYILLSTILVLTIDSTELYSYNLNSFSGSTELSFDWKESLELRRGGRGFGGSRRSFGSRRSSRNSPSKSARSSRSTPKTSPKAPSFGGNRISSSQAKQRYGVPSKTTPVTKKSATGQNTNYVMHHYGGYSSGLMTGYMMGSTSWMWMMPFHPAFYYSRPNYVENADGTVSVYPPTFSFGKLLMTLIIIGVIVYFVRAYFRNKNRVNETSNQGSFG